METFDVILCSVVLGILLVAFRKRGGSKDDTIPTVPSFLPWIGRAIEYGSNSFEYLLKCQARYGPAFKLHLAGRNFIVFCNEEGINDTLKDTNRTFTTYTSHRQLLDALGGVKQDAGVLMHDHLFPVISRAFSTADGVASLAPPFNTTLYSLLSNLEQNISGSSDVHLLHFIGENLYSATSKVVFGSEFPTDTYSDYETVDNHFVLLMSPIPFTGRAVKRARDRLVRAIEDYIQRSWKNSRLEGASAMATEMYRKIKGRRLSPSDEAGVVLTVMWGLHSNVINTSYWLFAYILADTPSFLRVREEIDSTLRTRFYGDINEFLSSPSASHNLPLLDSAIKETLRFIILMHSLREAQKDTTISFGEGQTAFIREGDLVLLYPGAASRTFKSGRELDRFCVDRYLPGKKMGNEGSTGTQPPFWGFGNGTGMCKGKYLALHELRTFFVICVYLFDMKLVDENGSVVQGPLPPTDPRSLGAARPSKSMFLRMSRRLK